MSEKKSEVSISAVGRRKTATATVKLISTLKNKLEIPFEVNGRVGEEYFHYNFIHLRQIQAPLKKVNLAEEYQIVARVKGGGLTGQADAIKLALARAICKLDYSAFRPILKSDGFLSRDARIKERRKYGLKKARKASQFSKR